MKIINKTLLCLSVICWTVFFCFMNTITNYWLGVAMLMALIAVTAAYALTLPSSVKTMSAGEQSTRSVHQQQASADMSAMDELYNKLLLDEILK